MTAGFANRSYPADELDGEVLAIAERVAKIPLDLLALNKRAAHRAMEAMGIRDGMRGDRRHPGARLPPAGVREYLASFARRACPRRSAIVTGVRRLPGALSRVTSLFRRRSMRWLTSVRGEARGGVLGLVVPGLAGHRLPAGAPARTWFALYAERFDTVEINNTFYRLPPPATVDGGPPRRRRASATP